MLETKTLEVNIKHGDEDSEVWGSYNDSDENLRLLLYVSLHTCVRMYRVYTMLTEEQSASRFRVIQGRMGHEPKHGTNILVPFFFF